MQTRGPRHQIEFRKQATCDPDALIETREPSMSFIYLLQKVIAAVLFQPSQELSRILGRERRNPASRPFRQSGASREEARKYWGSSALGFRGEIFAEGLNGGGRGAGSQLSRRDKAKSLLPLRKLTLRLVGVGLRSSPPNRDRVTLHQTPGATLRASGRQPVPVNDTSVVSGGADIAPDRRTRSVYPKLSECPGSNSPDYFRLAVRSSGLPMPGGVVKTRTMSS
jgi:hypothetical protein